VPKFLKRERDEYKTNMKVVEDVVFTVSGIPIKKVSKFQCLGHILDSKDSDCAAIQHALQREKIVWGRLGRLVSKEKTETQSMVSVYKAVVQSELLYGSESCRASITNVLNISPDNI
jgi:hypothetical protein